MHKSLIALVGAAGIGLAALTAPSTANAGCFGCAVGAGLLGGLFVGAVVGNAIANSPPPGYYPPPPGYYPPPPGYYGAASSRGLLSAAAGQVRLMRSSLRVAIGPSAESGSRAWVMTGARYRSVPDRAVLH